MNPTAVNEILNTAVASTSEVLVVSLVNIFGLGVVLFALGLAWSILDVMIFRNGNPFSGESIKSWAHRVKNM